jgi:hypothetical protein
MSFGGHKKRKEKKGNSESKKGRRKKLQKIEVKRRELSKCKRYLPS